MTSYSIDSIQTNMDSLTHTTHNIPYVHQMSNLNQGFMAYEWMNGMGIEDSKEKKMIRTSCIIFHYVSDVQLELNKQTSKQAATETHTSIVLMFSFGARSSPVVCTRIVSADRTKQNPVKGWLRNRKILLCSSAQYFARPAAPISLYKMCIRLAKPSGKCHQVSRRKINNGIFFYFV